MIYIFDIQAEDEAGNKSDALKFLLDYKDGKLYRICRDSNGSLEDNNGSNSGTPSNSESKVSSENVRNNL